ncbi:MAG: LCP family protein [Erysipelotrichaceae bacterium]|nr:LCP family protein [Erysipelotrichaceae bacterium]
MARKQTRKKTSIVIYIISMAAAVGLGVASWLAFKTVTGLNIIPQKYTDIMMYVLIGINALFGLIAVIPGVSNLNKILQTVISAALAVGLIYGNTIIPQYMGQFERMFNKVPEEGTLLMSVYTLKDSEIQDVNDLENVSVGVLAKKDADYLDYSYKVISRELNGEQIVPVEYEDFYLLGEDLLSGKIKAALMNQTYAQFISENSDFESFPQDTQVIYTIEHKIQLNYQSNAVGNITQEPFIIAVSGNDTWDYREMNPSNLTRSDVNMLVVVNPLTKKALIVSVPRDTYVPLWGDYDAMDKLTHATIYGMDTWEQTLNSLLETDINYFVRINFQSLVNVIDALGGIEIDNPYEMTIAFNTFDRETGQLSGETHTFEEGRIHITGNQALGYVRERKSLRNGDVDRVKHQAVVLKGIIDKVTQVSVITKVTDLLKAVEGTFITDLNTDQIYALVQMQLDDMASWDLASTTITGYGDMRTSYAMGSGDYEVEEEVEVEVPVVDEEGNPVYDEEGNQLIEIVTETQTVTHEAQTYAVFIPDDSSVQNAINAINEIMNERPVEQ